jgi:hypothetical protein
VSFRFGPVDVPDDGGLEQTDPPIDVIERDAGEGESR